MNYDEILSALGLNEKQRRIALDSDMVVTMAVKTLLCPSFSTPGGTERVDKTFIRVRERTGGIHSTSSELNVDSTLDISPHSDDANTSTMEPSRNNNYKVNRRDSTKAGGSKIMGIKFFETSTYGCDSSVGGSGSAQYPHGDVLNITRRAVNNRLELINRYFLVEKNGEPQLRLTTTCTQRVPQFKGGPIVNVSTEATTIFELSSRYPEADFDVMVPEMRVSDSLRESIMAHSDARSSSSTSRPSERVKSVDSIMTTPSTNMQDFRFSSAGDYTSGTAASGATTFTDGASSSLVCGLPDMNKRRRLISGMWVHSNSIRRGSVTAISTLNMQEILFNTSMTKVQIGDIRNPSRDNNNTDDKDKSVIRTMYKIDQNRTVRRKIEVEGETVEVDETCFWDASAAAAASASDVTTGALIIRQTDEINARETTFVRYVEKGADIEDESTAVDEQGKLLSHSRIYTTLRVVRLEKDLRTGAVIESENTYRRRKK